MLEQWQITTLEHDLLDYNAWGANAAAEGIYPDAETALKDKAAKCAERMINEHQSNHDVLTGTMAENIATCAAVDGYKNRTERDVEI